MPTVTPQKRQTIAPDQAAATRVTTRGEVPLEERKASQIASGAPYVDIDEINSVEGLFVVISQRRASGNYTFAVFKRFARHDGSYERTSFIPENMGATYLKLGKLALERIGEIRASGEAPFEEKTR